MISLLDLFNSYLQKIHLDSPHFFSTLPSQLSTFQQHNTSVYNTHNPLPREPYCFFNHLQFHNPPISFNKPLFYYCYTTQSSHITIPHYTTQHKHSSPSLLHHEISEKPQKHQPNAVKIHLTRQPKIHHHVNRVLIHKHHEHGSTSSWSIKTNSDNPQRNFWFIVITANTSYKQTRLLLFHSPTLNLAATVVNLVTPP